MQKEILMILTLTNITFLVIALFKVMQEGSDLGETIEELYTMYKEAPLKSFLIFLMAGILLAVYNAVYAAIACMYIKFRVFIIVSLILVGWSCGSVLNMVRYRTGGESVFSTNSKVFLLFSSVICNLAYLFYVLTFILSNYARY